MADQTTTPLLLESDLTITLAPGMDHTSDKLIKFRWNAQIALPYPFPSRICVSRDALVLDKPYRFQIHNHYDRVFYTIKNPATGATWVRSSMCDKRSPTPAAGQNCIDVRRQLLQSVAFFDGQTDYPSAAAAMADAGAKMQACMEWLTSFLAACQRNAPYLSSWLVYPVSLFDIGSVYCEVRGYCVGHQAWHFLESGVQSSVGRGLHQPVFFMTPPSSVEAETPLDTANELLAEALMASYRGMPRLTVINSYTALESFANVCYSQLKSAQLVAKGVDKEYAAEVVESHRVKHRNDASFLYHSGIKSASNRSFREERQSAYDEVMKLQQLRHRVAHTGCKPTLDEARDAHKLCCEVVQWFSEVAGFPVKPLRPAPEDSGQGFVAGLGLMCNASMGTVGGPRSTVKPQGEAFRREATPGDRTSDSMPAQSLTPPSGT